MRSSQAATWYADILADGETGVLGWCRRVRASQKGDAAAARASWVLVQQLVAQAIASGDLDQALTVAAVNAAIDTMPDTPARTSPDAVMMLEAWIDRNPVHSFRSRLMSGR